MDLLGQYFSPDSTGDASPPASVDPEAQNANESLDNVRANVRAAMGIDDDGE